jgi:UDP-N-acetylglucosamine--N-acetylmuramyl-(pentapeptide) pyrophosphoryl-undecaprenol N-acetylglucosamine transferase
MALVNDEAALFISDAEAREKLVPRVLELLGNSTEQNKLSENILKKAIANADERIVNVVKSIIS